jgi:betaine-aldehyde dehydrogenase
VSSTEAVVAGVTLRQLDRVGGAATVPSGTLSGWLCDPSSGVRLARQAATDIATVDRAISIADDVDRQGTWRNLSIDDRCAFLERIADKLEPMADEVGLAESLGSGVPISIARLFGGSLAGNFRDAIGHLRDGWVHTDLSEDGRPVELLRIPWGPTAIFVPFNAPAAMAAKKVAYALAAGAPVILKPPETAPFGCNLLADAIDSVGLPAGVFQMVHGGPEVGTRLTTDPRIRAISFTGGVTTGRLIAHAAAEQFTAIQLELGGNNPVVVRDDADIDLTAARLAEGMTKLNGQWCEAPGKILVARPLHDSLVEALVARLSAIRIGANMDVEAELGPIAHESHRDRLDAQVQELVGAGAEVIVAGETPDLPGWFWAPRIVVGADPRDAVEEMFGPVVTIHPVDSDDEAVAIANDSPYGLAAYVFGADVEAAMAVGRRIRFGEVKINSTSLLDLSPGSVQSFWRSSGIGGHGDTDVFRFFCGTQIVGVDRPGLPI